MKKIYNYLTRTGEIFKSKTLILIAFLLAINLVWGQTTLISPTGDGGFETGTTFASNGWTEVNAGANRGWYCGTGQTGYTGNRSAFIGNSTTTVGSNTTARTIHLYRSVTIPAGATGIQLSFKYKQATADYSSTGPTYYDYIAVYTGSTAPTSGSLPTGTLQYGPYPNVAVTSFTSQSLTLPSSLAGTTFNLIFTFKADSVSPHAYGAIDDISLVYTPPTTPFVSATAVTAFGNTCINTTAGPNSTTITGGNLTSNITLGALAGFSYSTTAGGSYTSTLDLTPSSGSVNQVVYIKFDPTLVQSYSGNIPITGGGLAATVNVAVTGAGVNTAPTVSVNGTAGSITTSGATISGSTISVLGCSGVTNYGIEYSTTTGFASGTGTQVVGTGFSGSAGGTFSTALTGLSASTTYYYKAFATNGAGTAYASTQSSFTTTCAAITTFPSTFDFATYLPNTCWFEGLAGDNTSGPTTISATASDWTSDDYLNSTSPVNLAARKEIYGNTSTNWIISPYYTIPATGYRMKYKVGATNWGAITAVANWESDDFVEVLVSTNNTNWTVLKTYNAANVPSHLGQIDTIDLSAYNGQTVHFAFKIFEGATWGSADIDFFVDDFTIQVAPTCLTVPTALVSSAITPTTATISWTAPASAPANGYEYYLSTSATTPLDTDSATNGTPAGIVTDNLSSLTANTLYYYWVRTVCSTSDKGEWTAGTAFRTACNAYSIPYNEGFETAVVPALPSCVTSSHPLTRSTTTTGAGPRTGTIYQNIRWTPTINKYLYSAPIALTTGTAYDMGGWYMTDGATGWTSIKLFVNTQPSITGATLLTTVNNAVNTTYSQIKGTYVAPATDTYYFFFEVIHTSGPNDMSIDDIFAVVTPPCPDASALAASNVTNTAATISWTAGTPTGPSITSHQYYYSTSATAPNAGTVPNGSVAVGTNTANITGLTANTTYYYWVRANCSVNLSNWIAGGSFTTTNVVYSVYTNSTPKSFNDTIDIYFEDLDPTNDFYTSGQSNIWMYAGVDTGAGAWGFNSNANINNNTTLVNFAQTATTGLYKATIKLADYFCVPAGAGTIYGINLLMENQWGPGGNNQTNNLYLDLTDAVVSINPPTAVASSAVTHNAATLSWTAPVQGANKGYEYAYSNTNSAPASGTATSALTINLTGLTPSTTYYYWVRTMGCSPDTSTWVAGQFSTACQTPVLTAVPATRCGTGTVNLAVTSDITSTVNWYAAATGGTPLTGGSNTLSYTTPSITATTSYWAEAYTTGPAVAQAIANSVTTPGVLTTSSTDAGVIFTTTQSNIVLSGAKIFVSGTGNMTFALQDSAGATIASTVIAISGATTGAFTNIALPNTFVTGAAAAGYRLLCTAKDAGITWYYETVTYPYATVAGEVSVTGGYGWTSATSYLTDARCVFGITANVAQRCTTSPRVQVTATVNAAPALTISSASGSSCAGTPTAAVTVTSTVGDYNSYVWSPAGATGDENAGWTFTSATSKVFTLTATNAGGCTNTTTYTYTATPAPTDVNITNTDAVACLNKLQTITVTGGEVTNVVILSENFNSGIGTFTATAASSTAAQDWTARANGYIYSSTTFSGSTNGFMMANSDTGGSGATTNTNLISPSFSTLGFTNMTLSLKEYLNNPTDTFAAIEISSDNFITSTSLRNNITTDIGSATAYNATAIAIPVAFENKASVKIRFKYQGSYDWYWAVDEINITGTTRPIEWSATNATLYTDAAGTVAYTAPGTYPTTVYAKPTANNAVITATATLGGCPKTDMVTFTTGTSTWDGFSWDNDPTGNTSLIIDGDYTEATDVVGCDCTITTNASTVTIPSGNTMTLTNGITNNGTSMVFESGASLLQTNPAAVNTGVITYNRTTPTLVNNLDFVYWGSPVSNQQIKNIWMTTANDTFYSFDASVPDWAYVAPSTVMLPGRGYIARAVDGATNATGNNTGTFAINGTWNAPFIGVPNNGNYPIGVYATPGIDNLLGNPYPSALDLNQLKTDNSSLLGTFYFWNHATGINSNSYDAAGDYAIYNANTGFGTAAGSGGTAPDQYVDAAQGFFADAATTGTVTFKNTQRVAGNNNAFYRVAPSTAVATPTSYALWLNLTGIAGTSTAGAFKQQFVGYVVNTTNNFDAGYDVNVYGGNPTIDFYSTIPSHKLAMQCRDFAFTDADVVLLGFQSIAGGTFKIAIDHSGTHDVSWYSGQRVYLQDNLLGIDFDLTNADYNFTTAAGTFDNRFVLKYTSTLGTNSEDYLNNSVIVAKDKNVLKIKSSIEEISKVTIFDMLGREVYKKDTINSKEFTDVNIIRNQQTLIVKIALANGVVVSKKIVY